MAEAVDAAKGLRDTLKWLAGSLAALAAAMLAGTAVSRIGLLNSSRLGWAVFFVLVSVGSIVWALSAIINALMPVESSIFEQNLSSDRLDIFVSNLRGSKDSVADISSKFKQTKEQREQNDAALATIPPNTPAWNGLMQTEAILASNLQDYIDVLESAAAMLGYWTLLDRFKPLIEALGRGILFSASLRLTEMSVDPFQITGPLRLSLPRRFALARTS